MSAGAAQGGARPFALLTRRRLLGLGLGGAVVAAGGVGLLASLRGSAPDVAGLRCLGPAHFRTLQHMARTHIPAGGALPPGADETELAKKFDIYLADEPEEHQTEIRRALDLVEFGPVLFDHRAVTFSHLTPAEQLTHWTAWGQSDVQLRRQVWWGFARFFGLVYYDTPALWATMGHPGPSFARLQAGKWP